MTDKLNIVQYTNREQYFKEMRKRSEVVYTHLVNYIDDQCYDTRIREAIMYFTSRRISSGCLLKPFLTLLSYESCGGADWESIIPAAISCELINISSYQSNSAFDNKYGVFEKKDQDDQIVASFITRELAEKIIAELDTNIKAEILKLISEINENIYIGQFLELNGLHFRNLDLNLSLKEYLKIYLRKCYTISGIFTANCASIGYILSKSSNSELLHDLKNFGIAYGIALNIINDLSDYLPAEEGLTTVYKNLTDQFSDMKNGRIFIPVYYALINGNQIQHEFILNLLEAPEKISNSITKELLKILIETKAIGFSYSVAKSFMKVAHSYLKKLPESESRSLLAIMLSSVRSNKFVSALRRHGLRAVNLDTGILDYINGYVKGKE